MAPDIDPIVSFGWMKVISEPLFLILHWMHEHVVSNWGWSILLLTLIINLAMLPTRITMMKSALKMQRIQPQMEAIKARYKNYKATDPRRAEMNQEIFALQKKEGANMFGGCLPMLIQWPLLYGFYNMLSNVFELRQAHWLWLPDLASPDPLHILPIFFIVSMFAGAIPHAVAGRRPGAAAHDGLHHAGGLRLHDLERCLRAGALLGLRQHRQHRPADGHEPHQARAGDARHCR